MKIKKRSIIFLIPLTIFLFMDNSHTHLMMAKYNFFLLSFLMFLMLTIKTNKYTINLHNLTTLTYFWFFWTPLFDTLYLSQYNKIVLFGDSVFNSLGSLSDEKMSYVYFSANIFLVVYLLSVYLISKTKFLRIPNQRMLPHTDMRLYIFLLISTIVVLILFNTHNESATDWTKAGPGSLLVNMRILVDTVLLYSLYLVFKQDIATKYHKYIYILLFFYIYYLLTKEPTRLNLIGFIVALGVVYERGLEKRIKPFIVLLSGIFGMVFMIVVAFTRTYINLDFSEILPKLGSLFVDIDIVNIIRNYFEIYAGLEYYYILMNNHVFVYNQLDYIIRFVAFFIPRAIYENKPDSISEVAGYIIGGEGFSCGVTAIGEVSLVFGITGVIFLGFIHSLSTVFFDKNTHSKFVTLYFIGISTYAFQFLRGPLDSLFHRVVIIFFVTIIILRMKKIILVES